MLFCLLNAIFAYRYNRRLLLRNKASPRYIKGNRRSDVGIKIQNKVDMTDPPAPTAAKKSIRCSTLEKSAISHKEE
jgi:hypothetical protein